MAPSGTHLTELNGVALQQSAKNEDLRIQGEQTVVCLQCILVKWESVMEKSWKH